MKVAITAEWMDTFGGGERVLLELHRMFPEAPIYTTVHDPRVLPPEMQGWDVRTSFIQKIPVVRRKHLRFLPLMPMAFEQFDFSEYDLVITTNSACAKGIITPPGTLNLCYCYTPCRYIWDLYHEYTRNHPARWLFAPMAHWLRTWDRVAADRVDHFIAISNEVSGRIQRHYRRESEVIHPPVDLQRMQPNGKPPEDFFLVVSRLVGYKRIDLAVAAANEAGRRLLVVGTGPEERKLRRMAGPTVEFLGWRSDAEVADLMARCRAFLFPGYEDFGIAPVEVQAAGRPVLAYARGGALDTVVEGKTGIFFHEQTVEAVVEAMHALDVQRLDPGMCRANAERFAAETFRRQIWSTVTTQARQAGLDFPPHQAAAFELESA
jgi:glycosyltransferase involved in cell wall biosynthesis